MVIVMIFLYFPPPSDPSHQGREAVRFVLNENVYYRY